MQKMFQVESCKSDMSETNGHASVAPTELVRAVRLRRQPEPIINGNRKCYQCENVKPISEFHKRKVIVRRGKKSWNWDGTTGKCVECARKYNAEKTHRYYKANPSKQLMRYYGITPEEDNTMLQKQNGGCAICGEKQNTRHTQKLYVDHNHKTGKVRGLLCHKCNHAIGNADDDPRLLRLMIGYLEKHGGYHV